MALRSAGLYGGHVLYRRIALAVLFVVGHIHAGFA
ncbi:MAG: hypothetical protein ACI9HH_004999, partial [Pseudomonadota bacterium]